MKLLSLLTTYSTYGNYGGYGYNNYGYPNTNPNAVDWNAIMEGGFALGFIFLLLVLLGVGILTIIAYWIIFKKMKIESWKSLIPYVNSYLEFEKTGVDQRWLLILVFSPIVLIIPFVGFLLFLVVMIYYRIVAMVSLARSFGKSDGFAVGLILLPVVFYCILAFGNSEYVGKNPMNDTVFRKHSSLEETKKIAKKEKIIFCPKCGEKISNNDSFCPKCGEKLK